VDVKVLRINLNRHGLGGIQLNVDGSLARQVRQPASNIVVNEIDVCVLQRPDVVVN
jgi:hypothetical protein